MPPYSNLMAKQRALNQKIRIAIFACNTQACGTKSDIQLAHPDWVREHSSGLHTALIKHYEEKFNKYQDEVERRNAKRGNH